MNHLDKCRECEGAIIEDDKEGTLVCGQCGLVNSTQLFMESWDTQCTQSYFSGDTHSSIYHDFSTFVAAHHLPDYYAEDMYNYYKKMKNQNYKFRRNHVLPVYCIYTILREKNQPYNLKQLAQIMNVDEMELIKLDACLQKKCNVVMPQLKPEEYVINVSSYFDLSFAETKIIENMVKKISCLGTYHPLTKVGTCMYIYFQHRHIKWTQKQIASLCSVSFGTMSRLYKKIKATPAMFNQLKVICQQYKNVSKMSKITN